MSALRYLMIGLISCVLPSLAGGAVVSWSDSFDSNNTTNINQDVSSGRQSGTLAPLSYRGEDGTWTAQINNNRLLVAQNAPHSRWIGPEHNFINTVGDTFALSVDVNPDRDATGGSWIWVRLGSDTHNTVTAAKSTTATAAAGFAFVLNGAGQYQGWYAGQMVGSGSVAPTTYYALDFNVSTTGGTSTLAATVDGVAIDLNGADPGLALSMAAITNNYVTLGMNGIDGNTTEVALFDNLAIMVPEPGSLALLGVMGLLGLRRRRR